MIQDFCDVIIIRPIFLIQIARYRRWFSCKLSVYLSFRTLLFVQCMHFSEIFNKFNVRHIGAYFCFFLHRSIKLCCTFNYFFKWSQYVYKNFSNFGFNLQRSHRGRTHCFKKFNFSVIPCDIFTTWCLCLYYFDLGECIK